MRRVYAQLDDGKTIDVYLDIDTFDLPVWSFTDRKFLILRNIKDTDTVQSFFERLSKKRLAQDEALLSLRNNGKEILNDQNGLKLHQVGINRFSQSSTTSLIARFGPELLA